MEREGRTRGTQNGQEGGSMKKAGMALLLAGVLLVGLSPAPMAFANGDHGKEGNEEFTKHFNKSLFQIGEDRVFTIEILPDDSEYNIGKNVVGIAVHDEEDRDVTGAKISVVLKDRQTGRPAPGDARVREKGGGLYLVSGLDLTQEGRFELKVTAKKGKKEDSATFLLPEAWDDVRPKGKYSP
jgi:hypothetical protein